MSDTTIVPHDENIVLNAHTSGQTSPEDGNTVFSHNRNPSLETVTSNTTQTVASEFSDGNPPAPPVNSPEGGSLAGDTMVDSTADNVDTASLVDRLDSMPGILTPPTSVRAAAGKMQIRGPPKGHTHIPGRFMSNTRGAKSQSGRPPVKPMNMSLQTKVQQNGIDHQVAQSMQDGDSTFEHTTWGELAEEDFARALARMAMYAQDEQRKDDFNHPISYYYSIRVAKLLKAGELTFDATCLE